jgi:hypothetical protein
MGIALEYDEVIHARLLQPDRHTQAREARPYDDLLILIIIHTRENSK